MTVDQERDLAFDAAAKFNAGNDLGLDAQADDRGNVTVFTGADDTLQEVATFESVGALETWSQSLDRMDQGSVEDAIETLVILAAEREARRQRTGHTTHTTADDLAYEPGDPKRTDFAA